MCLPDTAPPSGLLCRTLSDQLDKLIVARPDKIIVAQYAEYEIKQRKNFCCLERRDVDNLFFQNFLPVVGKTLTFELRGAVRRPA